MIFKGLLTIITLLILASCQSSTESPGNKAGKVFYEQKFDASMKTLPDDFFVMDGNFLLKKLGSNYALYLVPIPLNTFGCLFGPEMKESLTVSADIFSGKRGMTIPTFGVGTNGLSGFRLYVRGARKGAIVQLVYNETLVVASAPYEDWQTDTWTSLKMRVKIVGDKVEVYGKAWPQGTDEGEWLIQYSSEAPLDYGQCSIWGIPYSGRDIFFDNLKITKP